jgi:hypothetical protein
MLPLTPALSREGRGSRLSPLRRHSFSSCGRRDRMRGLLNRKARKPAAAKPPAVPA